MKDNPGTMASRNPRTRFTERKVFRSSIHLHLGGSRSRSIDEGSGSVEFHVDANTKKLVNTALNQTIKEKAPEFVTKPRRQFVNDGETAKFKASFEGSASTELIWSFKDKIVVKDDRHKMYKENDTHVFEITKVKSADQGMYICKIQNTGGTATAEAELEIFVRPKPQNGKSSRFVAPTVDIALEDTEFADKEKDATLVCKFHNGIDGKATWFKDGRELGSWQAKTSFDGRTAKLVLREASKRVCGVYECIVKNTGGEAKTRALVSLLNPSVKPVAPKFTISLIDQSVESGEKLVLETQVEGKPRPSLKWYKDNTELGSSQDIRMEYKDGKGRLIVDNLEPAEASKFTCIAQNVAGEAQTQSSVNVAASDESREPPIFTKELKDMEVNDGDRVELSVEVKGTPPTDIVWVHNNREIPPNDPVCRMVVDGNVHMLIIPEVFPEDSGEYVCEAYNDYGDTDTFCRLTVHEEKDDYPNSKLISNNISHIPPGFVVHQQKLHVNTGTSAILKCCVSGDPPPSVQWLKGVLTIKHGSKYKITSVGDEHYLEITSATKDDTGQYTCTLSNVAGTTSATTFVSVGEITPSSSITSSEQRSVLRNRSHYSHGERQNKIHREKSDSLNFTSLDSESQILKTKVKSTESVPLLAATKKVQTSKSLDISSYVREPKVFRTNVESSKSEPAQDFTSLIKTSKSEPENFRTAAKVKTSTLTVEKKGGINQVDFRGVLKNRNNPNKLLDNKDTLNGNSTKLVKDPDSKRSGSRGSGELRDVLSQKRQIFEVDNTIIQKNSVPKSVPSEKKSSLKLSGGKISQALQRFENKQDASQTDFRNVLKHRKDNDTSLSDRGVTKIRKAEELKKFQVPVVKMSHSETNIGLKQQFEIIKPETEIQPKLEMRHESGVKPEFRHKLDNQTVNNGSEVIMECEVSGTPEPNISWSINDKEIKQSKFFCMSYQNSIARLVIAEVFSEDEGEYTCKACNSEGETATSCCLQVQGRVSTPETTEEESSLEEPFSPTATPPKIYNISPSEFCILRGGTIEYKASFTSVPPGNVIWCKNKHQIHSDKRMKIETSEHFSTLTISDIQPGDSGRFDIQVENALGSDVSYASLTVQDVPEPPVGQPWVSEVTLSAATLSWYGPAYDGGCSVTNYRVEMCDAEDQEWIPVTSNCVDTTYRITKLTPHTPYFFRIFAENKHGTSQPCQTSDVTVTSDRRPSALQRLPSTESDDVFTHETNELFTPTCEYDIVSPLSPDEIPFEHRECLGKPGRAFDDYYNCMQEVGKGKFGSVYKCEEKSTGKIWAAKILKCRDSEKKKIHLEVDIMNQLKHPKILMLWDVFDVPRKIILVMEYIGGGELFERVIDDDFELTESDCIQFMRQILDAVYYMHGKNILHLDLKPENILCVKNESNKIKIIDFGLARFYKPGESTRVLFGTPEFIAPEVVNYDEIGFTTDMWSIGVICYVLLTGLSPFMGDSDAETLSNVTQGEFDFEDETFDMVSDDGKHFIECLLVKNKKRRMTSNQALEHRWLAQDAARMKNRRINTKNLKRFMLRRKWQKTGNAIRALGRMTSLQKLIRRDPSGNNSSATNNGEGSSSSCSSLSSQGSQDAMSPGAQNVSTLLKVSETEESHGVSNQNGEKIKPTNEINGRISNKVISEDKTFIPDKQTMDINSNNKSSLTNISSNSALEEICRNKEFLTNENSDINQPVRTANSCNESAAVQQHKSHHGSNHLNNHHQSESSKSSHPVFTKEMIDSKAFPGDAVRFDVEYKVEADVKVTWYFEDDILYEDTRHCVQENNGTCSLIIKDVCEEDDGEYSCKIVNNIGEETCSAELIVYGAI